MKKILLTALFSTAFMASQAYAGNAQNGQTLYAQCIGCHGATAQGSVGPKLAGQAADTLADKLQTYRSGGDIGPMSSMMKPLAAGLSDTDIADLAAYISSL